MAVAREFCAAVKERCDATDSGDGTLTQTNPRNVELRAQETDLAARIAQLQSELAEWERVEANLATSSTAAQQLLDEQIAAALAAGAEEALDAAAESSVAAPRASLARTAQEMVADVRSSLSPSRIPSPSAACPTWRRFRRSLSRSLALSLALSLSLSLSRPAAPRTAGGRAGRHRRTRGEAHRAHRRPK